jgi:O-succinylhomoserine sulfhydrylase
LSLWVEPVAVSALVPAGVLQAHRKVWPVLYPWLEPHPQHDLAKRQICAGGTLVTFELVDGKNEVARGDECS